MSFTIEKAKCIVATDKAICVQAPCFDEDTWIPLSQVDDESEVYKKGAEGDLVVSDWWAEKEDWA